MTVFVDTSAIFALLDEDSAVHASAVTAWSSLGERRESLVTSNYVMVESLTLVRLRLGAGIARRLVHDLLPVIEPRWVDQELHRSAQEAWLASGPSRVSFVDRVSFALMRDDAIRSAFAFDRDFVTAGFEVIPAPAG